MIELDDIYKRLKDGQELTKKISYTHKNKTDNKAKQMSIGRVWLNTLLPDDYPLINETIDKKKLDNLIDKIFKKYNTEQSTKILTKLQQEAFKLATISPSTFSIESFIIPKELEERKEQLKNLKKDITFQEYQIKVQELADDFIKYIKTQGYTLDNILNSGMKGSALTDWKTVMIAKGYMTDMEGNIYGPVNHGSSDGYTGQEYYKAAAEARRGFYFKSTAVQKPGYLARKVITASANIKLDKIDCKSKKYYRIKVNKNNAELLVGRYYSEGKDIIEVKDEEQIIGKTIKLRSPLYCNSKNGICKICYGRLADKLNSDNIGIIAGGAINTVVVNACMKLRHSTSQVNIIEVDFIKTLKDSKLISKDLNILLDIQKNKIIAKENCQIVIDKNEYNDTSLMNLSDKYIIPGLIEINFGKGNNQATITLPFNFKVNLIKPKEINIQGKLITLDYSSGETIIEKKEYVKDQDPAIVERLFEGQLKFIKDPEILINLMRDELPSIDLVHLELIVSNMFRNSDDLTVPCRLSNYNDPTIVGQKRLPFESGSWLNALAFENINKAVESGLIRNEDAEMNPLEKIIMEESQSAKI